MQVDYAMRREVCTEPKKDRYEKRERFGCKEREKEGKKKI